MARFADKPPLLALDGTEILAGTSVTGGDADPSGTVAPGADIHVPVDQLRDYIRAIKITSSIVSNTITPENDTDIVRAFALSAGLTIANPAVDPIDGWGFVVYLEDNGSSRTLTWGSMYSNSEFASLPTSTTAGKRHRLGFEYNATDDKLYCMYSEVEA